MKLHEEIKLKLEIVHKQNISTKERVDIHETLIRAQLATFKNETKEQID